MLFIAQRNNKRTVARTPTRAPSRSGAFFQTLTDSSGRISQMAASTMHCPACNGNPCHKLHFEQMLRDEGAALEDAHAPPNQIRHLLYRSYIRAVHGVLGFQNRQVIPTCVCDFIRELFPDPDGNYVGHVNVDETEQG